MQRARDSAEGETCSGCLLTANETNAQLLYETVTLWELHVEVTMGIVLVSPDGTVKPAAKTTDEKEGRLSYKEGTVAFGRHLDDKWDAVVKSLKARFQRIATARHWCVDFVVVLHQRPRATVCKL